MDCSAIEDTLPAVILYIWALYILLGIIYTVFLSGFKVGDLRSFEYAVGWIEVLEEQKS